MAERSTARFADRAGRHRIEPQPPEISTRRRGSSHQFDRFDEEHFDRIEVEHEEEPEFTDSPSRHRGIHRIEDEAGYAGPGTRRRLWLVAVGGPALGIVLCGSAFLFGQHDPPTGATLPAPIPFVTQSAIEEPSLPPVIPSTLPMPEQTSPSARPSASTSPTPAPTTPGSPSPALLGPSGRGGVENLVQRYCDRHSGGSADTRGDGRWECRRLLSSSIVDMNVACQDTYGSGAYARNPSPNDPYAWRCYR